jgi:hypothetical protein
LLAQAYLDDRRTRVPRRRLLAVASARAPGRFSEGDAFFRSAAGVLVTAALRAT